MPTRKQRRRQQKTRRHDYEYVYVDDDGNEVEVDPSDLPEKQNGKADASPRTASKRSAAPPAGGRTIQPPSWRRAFRRAAIWAPVLVIVMMLLNRNVSPLQWLTSAVFLIA